MFASQTIIRVTTMDKRYDNGKMSYILFLSLAFKHSDWKNCKLQITLWEFVFCSH